MIEVNIANYSAQSNTRPLLNRFTLPKGEILDVMYSNIRHAFFQPAEKEMITLLHFHLKNPIMVGKKKTADVQLYTEVMGDTVATLDSRSRSAYDPDELEEEQRERERKTRINLEFQRFTKRLQVPSRQSQSKPFSLSVILPETYWYYQSIPNKAC